MTWGAKLKLINKDCLFFLQVNLSLFLLNVDSKSSVKLCVKLFYDPCLIKSFIIPLQCLKFESSCDIFLKFPLLNTLICTYIYIIAHDRSIYYICISIIHIYIYMTTITTKKNSSYGQYDLEKVTDNCTLH